MQIAAAALLSAVLVIGLATAADYAFTVDEFNTDDYGPKALAWYTSGFNQSIAPILRPSGFRCGDHGSWFHTLTAYVQSFDLADRITVRHAVTFLFGLAGVAALLPIGRLAIGRWAGLTAIALCLMTGYSTAACSLRPSTSLSRRDHMGNSRHRDDDAGGAAVLASHGGRRLADRWP